MAAPDYRRFHNEELVELLFTEEDRVPRAAADEIVRRGSETLPFLTEIAMDRTLWPAEPPEWWAPVHATYLAGAIGGRGSLLPLLAALRWSDAYDNDWVTEDLPSILGSLGDISWPALKDAVLDLIAGWSARSIAMDALGSQAIRFPKREEEAMSLLGSILKDEREEFGARRSAAYVLLDFRRADLRKELIAFAKEDRSRQQQYPEYRVAFTVEDVEGDLASPRVGLDFYTREWMVFYNPDETRYRRERWAREEDSAHPDSFPSAPHAGRHALVIGRENPCPCGSGKPYKRCCWKKLH